MMEQAFSRLLDAYGEQHWWPAQTPFEVMVGAMLVQNTRWQNAEQAVAGLREHKALSAEAICAAADEELAEWIRSSGSFNVKAQRLKNYCAWYLEQGGFDELNQRETLELRRELLAINGIGPETADSILLYAFERPVFVVDEYTRRLFYRLGFINGNERYEDLRHVIEVILDLDVELYNEYHALIVRHAKQHCRKDPLCAGCPLDEICPE